MRLVPSAAAAAGLGVGVAAGAYGLVVRPWRRRWGYDPDEASRTLPGDEIVARPSATETRAITIEAPAAVVWPWLVQMGYRRAGWYSYDALDQRGPSVTEIVPDWQTLAVGDVLPTHPGGGFVVREITPERSLVLFFDTATLARQSAEAPPDEQPTRGVAFSGAVLGTQPSEFEATWTFMLEPVAEGRTRLIERFRIRFGAPSIGARISGPALAFGVFLMMRRQLIGIRDRAVRAVGPSSEPRSEPATSEPTTSLTGNAPTEA